jgi:hypothetical protein
MDKNREALLVPQNLAMVACMLAFVGFYLEPVTSSSTAQAVSVAAAVMVMVTLATGAALSRIAPTLQKLYMPVRLTTLAAAFATTMGVMVIAMTDIERFFDSAPSDPLVLAVLVGCAALMLVTSVIGKRAYQTSRPG